MSLEDFRGDRNRIYEGQGRSRSVMSQENRGRWSNGCVGEEWMREEVPDRLRWLQTPSQTGEGGGEGGRGIVLTKK